MNRGELHRLYRLINALRDAISSTGKTTVDAITEQTHTIKEASEKQPSRVSVDIQIPREEIDHYYNEQTKAQRLQWWIFVASGATFLAVAIYAVITYATFKEISRQTTQLEADNRPWIKIIDVGLDNIHPPVLDFMMLNKSPMANIRLVITVKNIGKGVARGVWIVPNFVFYKWNSTAKLTAEQDRVCSLVNTRWGDPGPPFTWATLFPEETRSSPIVTGAFYTEDMFYHPTNRVGNWISGLVFACVWYQTPRGYSTSAVFNVMGQQDRFIEVGKDLDETKIRLLRDEHYEYAQ